MSLIITATDFTETANNAVHFACELAAHYKAQVAVLNTYTVPISYDNPSMPLIPVEESRDIADGEMQQLVAHLNTLYPGVNIQGHVSYGEITDYLTEFAAGNKPWMIVAGNSLSEEDSFWNGAHLMGMMRHMPYAVLAVPAGGTYHTPQNICFACDYSHEMDEHLASSVTGLVKSLDAKLHVLNIDHNNKGVDTSASIIAQSLHEKLADAKPEFHFTDNQHVSDGVSEFVSMHHIDWLIVSPHRYSLLEGLFHKSRTKELAKAIQIPIVALH